MANVQEIITKVHRGLPLTLKEAEILLRHLGYVWHRGKGSHQNWKHPRRTRIFTLAVHGKELPRYITRELRKMLFEEDV